MRRSRTLAPLCLGLLAIVIPLAAHHSTAMYDLAHPTTVTGAVKRFEWTNPHAFIYLDVTDGKGEPVEWEIEMMNLNHLRSYGWMRSTLRPGDRIRCTGGAARNGQAAMLSSLIELPDGRRIKS